MREGFLTTDVDEDVHAMPEDVAALALFLCSDAGAKISGQALAVDGHTEGLGYAGRAGTKPRRAMTQSTKNLIRMERPR